jgi:hypothetical protein
LVARDRHCAGWLGIRDERRHGLSAGTRTQDSPYPTRRPFSFYNVKHLHKNAAGHGFPVFWQRLPCLTQFNQGYV